MISGIGIDIVETERFRETLRDARDQFMQNTFSDVERTYCSSYQDSAIHFAGTFAAKEAVKKATGEFSFPLHEIEIRRDPSGKPETYIKGRRDTSILVSISHTDTTACAVAMKQVV